MDSSIRIREQPRFASRGGEKLAAALEAFALRPQGWVCADVGASTGGFTDCLLQAGAERVYALDVGYGQLAWPLRQDNRVIVMERTNARHVERLPEPVDLVTIDVSFISLSLLLPVIQTWLKPDGQVIALVKPQFEAGKKDVGKGGVVRDSAVHRRVLKDVILAAQRCGLAPSGLIRSPLLGPAGNTEFLLWLSSRCPASDREIEALIRACVPDQEIETR
jgi:23S rRNA (cytidine1920-2'-O)/16S rRNA (cytidine1409-2'-O)-methyltransferase